MQQAEATVSKFEGLVQTYGEDFTLIELLNLWTDRVGHCLIEVDNSEKTYPVPINHHLDHLHIWVNQSSIRRKFYTWLGKNGWMKKVEAGKVNPFSAKVPTELAVESGFAEKFNEWDETKGEESSKYEWTRDGIERLTNDFNAQSEENPMKIA